MNLKKLSKEKTVVSFDIETNGANEKTSDIIKICAIKLKNGEIIDTFSSFINVKKPLIKEIIELTGITDGDLIGAEQAEAVLCNFYEFCQDCVLLCSYKDFDFKFLNEAVKKFNLNISFNDFEVIDVVEYSRKILASEVEKFSLKDVVKFLGVKSTETGLMRYADEQYKIFTEISKKQNVLIGKY